MANKNRPPPLPYPRLMLDKLSKVLQLLNVPVAMRTFTDAELALMDNYMYVLLQQLRLYHQFRMGLNL